MLIACIFMIEMAQNLTVGKVVMMYFEHITLKSHSVAIFIHCIVKVERQT